FPAACREGLSSRLHGKFSALYTPSYDLGLRLPLSRRVSCPAFAFARLSFGALPEHRSITSCHLRVPCFNYIIVCKLLYCRVSNEEKNGNRPPARQNSRCQRYLRYDSGVENETGRSDKGFHNRHGRRNLPRQPPTARGRRARRVAPPLWEALPLPDELERALAFRALAEALPPWDRGRGRALLHERPRDCGLPGLAEAGRQRLCHRRARPH